MLDELRFRARKLFSGTKVKLLSIGVHEGWAGPCLGADRGAERLYKLIKPRCNYSCILVDALATKANVLSEMQKVCNSDLAIITYAGHGGQQSGRQFEDDNRDELIALYDKPLVDNEIWSVISKAKGRVFTIFDCCHSGTMFCDARNNLEFRIAALPVDQLDLLCWSACADNKLGYSSDTGGLLSSAICNHADAGYTYDKLWSKVSNDARLAQYEVAQRTLLRPNTGFNGKKIFS